MSYYVPRLHSGHCGMCLCSVDAPRMSAYDHHKNEKVKFCSKGCYRDFLDIFQARRQTKEMLAKKKLINHLKQDEETDRRIITYLTKMRMFQEKLDG